MAGDWQELAQTAAIGLIFAFLAAKLISTVIAFKEDNLRITRSPPSSPRVTSRSPAGPATPAPGVPPPPSHDTYGDDSSDGSDSDWEGVESTELDEEFSAASAFVAASGTSVPEEAQLRLYGLYKIATEGPCTAPQPSALKLKARAKWNAWHKLGAMPTEKAMQEYITIVDELFPNWASGSSIKRKGEDSLTSASGSKGPMGPVFSSLIYEEDEGNDSELGDIHVSAREGAIDGIAKQLAAGVEVNMRDSEGRTPLHWAVDRGHLNAVEVLANASADLNAQIHRATKCRRNIFDAESEPAEPNRPSLSSMFRTMKDRQHFTMPFFVKEKTLLSCLSSIMLILGSRMRTGAQHATYALQTGLLCMNQTDEHGSSGPSF